jgi:hypothetical protein
LAISVSCGFGAVENPPVAGVEVTGPQVRSLHHTLADESANTLLDLIAKPVDSLFALAEVVDFALV